MPGQSFYIPLLNPVPFSTSPIAAYISIPQTVPGGKKKIKKPGNAFDHLGRGISLVHPDTGPFYGTESFCVAIHPEDITLYTINKHYAS